MQGPLTGAKLVDNTVCRDLYYYTKNYYTKKYINE